VDELLHRVDPSSGRYVLGIAGPPGAGKSTIATAVAAAAVARRGTGFAAVAPMDGFHRSNEDLDAHGLLAVKGAPETFDAAALVERLRDVRALPGATLHWPGFDRGREQTVKDAIAILPTTRLVVDEGNYLLLDQPHWRELRPLLDETWYVDAPLLVLRTRLLERARAGGRSEAGAIAHVDGSDLRNARLVAATKTIADRQLAGAAPTDARWRRGD
jgi:pantothenate kinase